MTKGQEKTMDADLKKAEEVLAAATQHKAISVTDLRDMIKAALSSAREAEREKAVNILLGIRFKVRNLPSRKSSGTIWEKWEELKRLVDDVLEKGYGKALANLTEKP